MTTVIRGGTVLTAAPEAEAFAPGEVAFDGAVLTYVGPPRPGEGGGPASSASIIDASGCLIIPGLVNAHTHAAMVLFRGFAMDLPLQTWLEEHIWPAEAGLEPDDVYWGTLAAAGEMLRGGITCFADMYFHPGRAAAAVLESGIRASLAPGLIGVLPGADRALEATRDFFAEWHGREGRIRAMVGPHAPHTCPAPYLRQCAELAGELDAGIHIHLSETKAEVEDSLRRHGCTPPEWIRRQGLFDHRVLIGHGVHLTPEDCHLVARAQGSAGGGGLAHCPVTNALQGSGIAPLRRLRDEGATVGLGTDGAASTGPLDLFLHARTAAYLQKVAAGDAGALPAASLLPMLTRAGALAAGWPECGVLAPGHAADVVVVRADAPHVWPAADPVLALAYCVRPDDVRDVWVAGRRVVEDGRPTTLDWEAVRAEVGRRARRLTGRG